jgi:hypothetical protein
MTKLGMAKYIQLQRGKMPFANIKCFTTLQSLTGNYREIQGNPCNENRDLAMRTGFPCNKSRFFPVGIDLQGLGLQCTGGGGQI